MTAEVSEHSGSKGMRDCGATCSAGPESSIKNLINAVLEKDKSARITVDRKRCPKFRYGSGKWGKALYRITLQSSLTPRAFHAYALPDPEESREPWFTSNMLVPVLIGLDLIHLHGLIVDFNDGTTVCAKRDDPKPFNYIVTPRII